MSRFMVDFVRFAKNTVDFIVTRNVNRFSNRSRIVSETIMLFRKALISRVFEEIRDFKGDINISDLEKTLSDDAEVAGTQNIFRASSPSLVFIGFVWLHIKNITFPGTQIQIKKLKSNVL